MRVLSAFRPYRHLVRPVLPQLLVAVFFGMVYSVASGFGIPFMAQKVLPALFPGAGPRPDMVLVNFPKWIDRAPIVVAADKVWIFVLILPLVFVVRSLAQFFKDYLMNSAGMRVLESLRIEVFRKLQALHLDFFRKIPAGDISQRMSGDTAIVRYALIDVIGELITQPFMLVSSFGYVAYAAYTTPGLGRFALSLLIVPATVLPIRLIGKKLQKRARQMLAEGGAMNAMLVESIQAPREIRAYNLQKREVDRYRERTGRFLRLQIKLVKYEKALSPVIECFAVVSIFAAIWQVVRLNSTVKTEDIVAIVGALYFCYNPVKLLGGVNNRLKQAAEALSRLEEIIAAPIEVADPAEPVPMGEITGEIRFENVGFTYPAGGKIFDDLSIAIRPGEVVALVGPSGAGKTTFANLVPRFYDATSGRVLIDGMDVRTVSQNDLRAHIALVSQETILFDDTVAANLRIGKPDATDAELREASRKAGALVFIESLPLGFETRVGERGGLLSGGQRQRISIARAFLKNVPVLILDEATSALDSETEAQIQVSLEELVKGKTVLIIAHRFSTIRFATRILVFDKDGAGVVADGTHDHLIETSPLYRSLYERQKFGGE